LTKRVSNPFAAESKPTSNKLRGPLPLTKSCNLGISKINN